MLVEGGFDTLAFLRGTAESKATAETREEEPQGELLGAINKQLWLQALSQRTYGIAE
jgi:hypothetical protein